MQLCALLDETYDMEHLWGSGGKAWTYEYKYRRGGRTLCALYARERCVGFLVILGKDERLKFENDKEHYAKEVQSIYEENGNAALYVQRKLHSCLKSAQRANGVVLF